MRIQQKPYKTKWKEKKEENKNILQDIAHR